MTPLDQAIRPARPDDLPFLKEMLFEAFFWRSEQARPTHKDFERNAEFAKLLRHWGRPGDRAVIAETDGQAVGAAWFSVWNAAEHSYGYVDEATPELGMGVRPEFRGRGFGRRLLRALIDQAQQDGLAALSLSLEVDNYSRKLYESEGFVKVAEVGGAWTMVKRLVNSEG